MLGVRRQPLALAVDSIRAHKLRASLTVLGLTMGVATLITVMTLVQGANLYVEQKIANLGTNVFRIARTPFAVTDFTVVAEGAQRNREHLPGRPATRWPQTCAHCQYVGASSQATLIAALPGPRSWTTRTSTATRPTWPRSTPAPSSWAATSPRSEDQHAARRLPDRRPRWRRNSSRASNPIGQVDPAGGTEFTVIGTFEKIGSVLGQDQDNFVVIPLRTYLKFRGQRNSLTLQVKAEGGEQDLRARRRTRRAASCARAATSRPARTTISSSARRTATSRCGRASARRSSPSSSW